VTDSDRQTGRAKLSSTASPLKTWKGPARLRPRHQNYRIPDEAIRVRRERVFRAHVDPATIHSAARRRLMKVCTRWFENRRNSAMSTSAKHHTGGCLCGALRYEADGEPLYAGHCYCADCRKASGSGFVPFMGFAGSAVRFIGRSRIFTTKSLKGTNAVRNFCPVCSSLVFGGEVGKSDQFTIYSGSLDDPSHFHPTIAIFTRNRPIWAAIPPGLTLFETTPA
jgi:hypothetical protein